MENENTTLPTYEQLKKRGIINHYAAPVASGGPVFLFLNMVLNHGCTMVYAASIIIRQSKRTLATFNGLTDYVKTPDHMMDMGPQRLLPENMPQESVYVPSSQQLAQAAALFTLHQRDILHNSDLKLPLYSIDLTPTSRTSMEFLRQSEFNAALLPGSHLPTKRKLMMGFPVEDLFNVRAILLGMDALAAWYERPQYNGPFNIQQKMEADIAWFSDKFKLRRPLLSNLGL